MKLKHKLNAVLFFSLLSSLTIPSVSFSGTWIKNNESWYYTENDKKLTNWQNINNNYYYFDNDGKMYTGWLKDKDNNFYFLENEKNGNEGILSSGWKLIDSNWYFLNNKHDGFFGKMLTGWHWIDSKCYYFDINGKMLFNTKTPDGYDVNSDGAWTINGKIQIGNSEYTTKIISTNTEISKIASSGGNFSSVSSGGEGSSGGGSGGGSSYTFTPTKKTYTYTIKYVNADGIIIKKIDGKKEEGSSIQIDKTEIDGYTFETEDSFILNQNIEKIITLKEKTTKRKTLYKVRFLSRDGKKKILNDINGEGIVDEDVPVYFQRFVNLSDGTKWMAIGNSPRSFKLTSLTNNNFDIYYINIGNMEKEKIPTMTYTIKYIADDTGATLGISTGYAKKDEIIPYRNNILYYGFEDNDSSNKYLKISDNPDDNTIEVKMRRISFPAPIKDERTGKYKGFEWDIFFMDEDGKELLPMVKGFTADKTNLIVDYPNEINLADGYVYRAKTKTPYNKYLEGTGYRQIVIVYQKGEKSESKLENYKKESVLLNNIFNKKIPLEYTVKYKEKNSWNDIGIYKNIG